MSDRAWLGVTVGALAAYDIARRTLLPDGVHFAANTAMIAVLAALAAGASLTKVELGLERARLAAGARLGLTVLAIVMAVVVIVVAVSDDPFGLVSGRADVSRGEMLFQVLVEIPLATVLVEEFAFRGVMAALLERVAARGPAVMWSAVLFGLWHLAPAWPTAHVGSVARAVGTVVATAVAGAVLHLLKRRSGSLLAPVIAHWATNGAALAVAWLMTR